MVGRSSLAAALFVFALAGCGGSATLAHVGDRSITQAQVQRLVEHGREEAAREGADFPARGDDGYRALERQALAILVARVQVEQAARRLGVAVSDAEVQARVPLPHKELVEVAYEGARRQLGFPEENEKGTAAKLLGDAVRVQLTLQRVERRIGAARVPAWLAAARRIPVEYADGWAP
jgi:hypothetical protein